MKNLCAKKNKQAFVMILTLVILMVLSLAGASFVNLTALNLQASKNDHITWQARLTARSGVDYALCHLIEDFQGNPQNMDYKYFQPDIDAVDDPGYSFSSYAEDDIGVGVAIKDIQQVLIPNTNHPSLKKEFNGRNISGKLQSQQVFTLKIFDVTSQVNINSQARFLGEMLDNLSKAIALRKPYIDEVGNDGIGPLKGLGNAIVSHRPISGYRSKQQIIGISGNNKTITKKDFAYIKDYITVYPTLPQMQNNDLHKNIAFAVLNDETSYQQEMRSPININAASWPVLVAVFRGLQSSDGILIDENEAIILANRVCVRRRFSPFTGVQSFFEFLKTEQNDIFSSDVIRKAEIVKANCKTDTALRRFNADSMLFQFINKAHLVYYTTEFCFAPIGVFEINSLGEILEADNSIRGFSQYHTIVKVFDLLTYKSQKNFEVNRDYNNLDERIQNLQGFSHVNNLQKENSNNAHASKFFGHIQPVQYTTLTGFSGLDEPQETNQGGAKEPGKGGNYLFRADFNGIMDANKAESPTAHGTKANAVSSGGLAAPDDANSFADLVADGVVMRSGENNADTLYYFSRPSEDPQTDNATAAGNFPAMISAPGIVPLNGDANEGSLMFWFKLDSAWNSSEFRTVFFANTAMSIPDPLGGNFQMGVQREVQMKVSAPDLANKPKLRDVEIQVRSKFFCQKNGVSTTPPSVFMPYQHVDFGRRIELKASDNKGLHSQEWYHLGVRWKNGNTLNDFALGESGNANSAMVVTGQFYNQDDKVQNSFMHFNENGSFFNDNGNMVDNIEYQSTQSASHFDPLDDGLKNSNRFYIGSAGRTSSAQMTIDDIRITKNTSWAGDPSYQPSRFPLPKDPNNPVNSEFKLNFTLPPGSTTLFIQPEVHYDNDSSSSSTTIPSDHVQVGNKMISLLALIQIWLTMTQAPPPLSFISSLDKWTDADIQVQGAGLLKTKSVNINVKDNLGNNIFTINTSGPSVMPTEQDNYQFAPASGPSFSDPTGFTLADRLIDWYRFRNGGQDPPELLPLPGEINPFAVPVATKSPSGNKVDIQFFANGSKPVFKSPAVTKITLGYLQKFHYFIYSEIFS